MTAPRPWPDLPIAEMALFVETWTTQFDGAYTRQAQTMPRATDRWAAEVTVTLDGADAAHFAAFAASLRGPHATVLVPDQHFRGVRGSLRPFDEYSAAIGPTDFDDATAWTDGTAFYEGDGTPTLRGGKDHQFVLTGCYPDEDGILATADAIQSGLGDMAIVTSDTGAVTDMNGYVVYPCAPEFREPCDIGPVATGSPAVEMRLASDDAIDVSTVPPLRTTVHLSLIEALQ